MKALWNSFCTAFSLYSTIPMPKVAWDKGNIRYALCFFPLVGAIIGGLELGWFLLSTKLGLATGLFAAVAVLLPIVVTGGIHMDGWVDTVDAMSAHADMDKRQEILKDPHVGAFGVIFCGVYLLLQWGLWQQIYLKPALAFFPAAGFLLSRALNALSIATFPTSKQSGLVYLFQDGSARSVAALTSGMFFLYTVWSWATISVLWCGVLAGAAIAYFLFHRWFCTVKFGGNSGDLAGFLLQNVEIACLVVAAAGGLLS